MKPLSPETDQIRESALKAIEDAKGIADKKQEVIDKIEKVKKPKNPTLKDLEARILNLEEIILNA
jgi:hypothetical protein